MRVYIPATWPMLRKLVANDRLDPVGGTAFALTPKLRESYTVGDDDELECHGRNRWGELEVPPGPWLDVAVSHFDTCALDAEGCIWSADAVGGRAARLAPGGEILDVVAGPEGLGVFACMLGGEDGRTLLLCSAPDFLEHLRMDAREAVLVTTTVDVPHAGLP